METPISKPSLQWHMWHMWYPNVRSPFIGLRSHVTAALMSCPEERSDNFGGITWTAMGIAWWLHGDSAVGSSTGVPEHQLFFWLGAIETINPGMAGLDDIALLFDQSTLISSIMGKMRTLQRNQRWLTGQSSNLKNGRTDHSDRRNWPQNRPGRSRLPGTSAARS